MLLPGERGGRGGSFNFGKSGAGGTERYGGGPKRQKMGTRKEMEKGFPGRGEKKGGFQKSIGIEHTPKKEILKSR